MQAEGGGGGDARVGLGCGRGARGAMALRVFRGAGVGWLDCARLGAAHAVVVGGFSAEGLHSRIDDVEGTVVITADGGYRRGAPSALKPWASVTIRILARLSAPSTSATSVWCGIGHPVLSASGVQTSASSLGSGLAGPQWGGRGA